MSEPPRPREGEGKGTMISIGSTGKLEEYLHRALCVFVAYVLLSGVASEKRGILEMGDDYRSTRSEKTK